MAPVVSHIPGDANVAAIEDVSYMQKGKGKGKGKKKGEGKGKPNNNKNNHNYQWNNNKDKGKKRKNNKQPHYQQRHLHLLLRRRLLVLQHHHGLIVQLAAISIDLVQPTRLMTRSQQASCTWMSRRAPKKLNCLHLPCLTTSCYKLGIRMICQPMQSRTSSKRCSTFQQLQQQQVGTPINKNNLTDKQRCNIIDTRWAISETPSSSASSKTTLKARFCGRGFTQYVDNANVESETYNATPSSQSLCLLLEHSIIQNWQVTSRDVSSAFLNTPISSEILVAPPHSSCKTPTSSGVLTRPFMVYDLLPNYGNNISEQPWQNCIFTDRYLIVVFG